MEKENSVNLDEIETELTKYAIRKPRACYIHLPDYCFMRCKMCTFWKNKVILPPISLKQWEYFFASLKNFLGGAITISIGGGEFFTYRDSFTLIKMIDDLGFKTNVTSNGYLINYSIAKKIAESNLQHIGISLDGFNSQTHDYLRGRSNSFTRVMNAIRYLRSSSSKLIIGIMTIIMEKNKDEIIPLVQWVQENKDLNYINFQAIMQPFGEAPDTGWYRKDNYKEFWPHDIDKICNMLDSLIKLKGSAFSKIGNPIPQLETFKKYFKDPENLIRKNPICSSIDYGISIDYYGGIHLCESYNIIGDIFHDFRETFYSIGAQDVRKQIISCKKNCHMLVNCMQED